MYKTRDLYLTGTLILLGHELLNHEENDKVCIFYFNETEELRKAVKNYFYDKITVSPHKLQTAIKTVKSLIYS